MTIRGWMFTAVMLLPLAACQGEGQKPGAASAEPKSAKAPPADAKTIAAFRADKPAKGSTAKIHGYVGSVNGKAWPLVDKVGDTLPFVFCDMAAPPAGVAKGAHVVASGKVEDDAMLKECTITPL